ncbi:TIR domain-containing protein [Pantoea sp. C8B4]|uniref:TIR domain-containing protein n=1 Tax=Pantoea sp. C8B4 TaxID=3243083 RepID=UPI003EDB5FC8
MIQPKVFISYSWSSKTHQQHIKDIADRLAADGVESVVDIFDLNEGDDKYHYMERMVQDSSVTHVLVICDQKYSEKADARKDGVGVESMIISQEIYSKVSQSKFIPLIFEYKDGGEPYTPTFLKSRIYIDFSTPEKENDNWERLIRVLFGQPEFTRPKLGKPPAYLQQSTLAPTYELHAKFNNLKSAISNQRSNIKECRRQFLDTVYEYCESLRIVENPSDDIPGEVILVHKNLISARDILIDWILLEGESEGDEFTKNMLHVTEWLFGIKERPESLRAYSDVWFLPHRIFAYETFLYAVAALVKVEAFSRIYELLNSSYLLPAHIRSRGMEFSDFSELYINSDYLQSKLAPENYRLNSPVAELIKLSATRADITFDDVKQADLVVLMVSLIKGRHWYPQTLLYSGHYETYPLFTRAIQRRGFKSIAEITGISDSDVLAQKVKEGDNLANTRNWNQFGFGRNFLDAMNIDRLNTHS